MDVYGYTQMSEQLVNVGLSKNRFCYIWGVWRISKLLEFKFIAPWVVLNEYYAGQETFASFCIFCITRLLFVAFLFTLLLFTTLIPIVLDLKRIGSVVIRIAHTTLIPYLSIQVCLVIIHCMTYSLCALYNTQYW